MQGHNKYQLLLNSQEWSDKRKKILARDKFKCTCCQRSGSLYINGKNILMEDPKTVMIDGQEIYTEPFKALTLEKPLFLQVHHKYYLMEEDVLKNPWDYPDDALITLCGDCHQNTHNEEHIPIFYFRDGELSENNNFIVCHNCGGEGFIPQYSYHKGGICFMCWGRGIIKTIVL